MYLVVVAGLIGLFGVLIGSALTFGLELWRIVIRSKAAARVVRFEMQSNANRCLLVIHARTSLSLVDRGWIKHREQLVQVLPPDAYFEVDTAYAAMPVVQQRIEEIANRFEFSKDELEQWTKQMIRHAGLFTQIEQRRRMAQMIDVLLGRPTFPTAAVRGPAPAIVLPNIVEDIRPESPPRSATVEPNTEEGTT